MKISYIIILVLLIKTGILYSQTQEIFINEFLASNSSINKDLDFNLYSDWIEFYNPQNKTVDLSNYYLTDDLDNPTKWKFTEGIQIPPNNYLIIWADDKDTVLNEYHTNFKLAQGGEEIGLFDPDEMLVDQIIFNGQQTDISFGRQPDGDSNWFSFYIPTPSSSNSESVYLKSDPPSFSLSAGFYTAEQILEITSNDPLAEIRFTTNGDEPTILSEIYSAPIFIKSRIGDPNIFSQIRTNRDPHEWLPDWAPPNNEIFKANVIRARTFRDGYIPSDIVTSTYFVDNNIYERYSTLPVISLNSDYKHLFDNVTGIYVPGIYHSPGNSGSGNYFKDWEKPAHIEYFEPGGDLGFSQDVGIRIQGGTSPASPQKGLHVIARNDYGKNTISYPLFTKDPSKAKKLNEFKRFIIRAWGSLITGALFNDAYAHRLMASEDLDIQGYQPAVVFINGEYWGLHELREANKNSWYFQSHYSINRDDPGYDILVHSRRDGKSYPYVDEGDAIHWNSMMNFLKTHDMNLSENYEYLKTQIDMENFITYLGHCIFVGKWDWPNNNDASWRPRIAEGKWRWIQYDMETGFGVATSLGPQYALLGPQLDMVRAVTDGIFIPNFGTFGPHPIVAEIHDNIEFRNSLADWFQWHLNHNLSSDSMNQLLDEMSDEIRPYMEEYKERWPFIGGVNSEWANSLGQIKDFNQKRYDYFMSHPVDIHDTKINLPTDFELSQNYPNPFNPSTTIKYSISKQSNVTLQVFDILGREIESLISREHNRGIYEIEFDGSTLTSGIYYYRLRVYPANSGASNIIDIKKMILLK